MIIHKMNRVSGFIIIITGALVRISEYHIILDILIKSRYNTAVRSLNTAVRRGTKFSAVPNTTGKCVYSYHPLTCVGRLHICFNYLSEFINYLRYTYIYLSLNMKLLYRPNKLMAYAVIFHCYV